MLVDVFILTDDACKPLYKIFAKKLSIAHPTRINYMTSVEINKFFVDPHYYRRNDQSADELTQRDGKSESILVDGHTSHRVLLYCVGDNIDERGAHEQNNIL